MRDGRAIIQTWMSPGPSPLTFVLVHGIGMSHRYLRRLHEALSLHGAVVSVDLPGFGGLPKPAVDLDVPAMADALAEVLDALGVGPAVLVGHSMGTQWVTELAVRRPDLAQSVVLIGPVVDDRRRSVLKQAADLALDTLGETPTANAAVFADYLRCGPRWYLAQLRPMLGYRIEERVGLLRAPLLIIRGSGDPVARRGWCRRLRDDAEADALLVEIPGRVHNAQLSAPRAVAAAILHHCRRMPPLPGSARERTPGAAQRPSGQGSAR